MKWIIVVGNIFISSLVFAQTATAPVDIQFIVDSSGSMEMPLGTSTQIDIAKLSLKQTLGYIPPTTSVSLCVYGHRIPKTEKEKSCLDAEVMVPFKPLDAASFTTKVDSLKPNGYTPIAYSLRECSKAFTNKENKHVIILLSDGEETCGGDPVQEARNLLAEGFKVIIHTIGFRVDEKTKAQLTAISQATGGLYFDAVDAMSLADKLKQATEKALFIEKTKEEVRGREIRGGNGFQDAVLLESGVEYRLDHHQKPNDFDYYFVDLKKGQTLNVTLSTTDKGLSVSGNTIREGGSPDAGIRILNSQFKDIGSDWLHGSYRKKEFNIPAPKEGEKIYILVGMKEYAMHKDSPFRVEIKNYSDANIGADAGEDILHASPIPTGEYTENWIIDDSDKDNFVITAKANESYSVVVTPSSMDLRTTVAVFDRDRVFLTSKTAPNAGAIVRLEGIVPKYDGPLYVQVGYDGYRTDFTPQKYSISIQAREIENSNQPAVTGSQPLPSPITGMQQQLPEETKRAIQAMGQLGETFKKMDEQMGREIKTAEKQREKAKTLVKLGITKIVIYALVILLGVIIIIAAIIFVVAKGSKR